MEVIKNTKNINRCSHSDCNKKLTLVDFPCRCELTFCALHRHSTNHNCTFDYKVHGQHILTKTVVGCTNEKVLCI